MTPRPLSATKDVSKAGGLHLEDYTPTALIKPFISLHGHGREHKVSAVVKIDLK